MEKIVLNILVVLYNRKPEKSETLVSLSKCVNDLLDSRIFVWDNSVLSFQDKEILTLNKMLKGVEYYYYWGNGENVHLSVIYNKFIKEVAEDEYFVIFDHDSNFEVSFFNDLYLAINLYPNIDLFLPIVYSQGKIVSPATKKYFRGHLWKEPRYGIQPTEKLAAINSGMAISGSFLCNEFEGYDQDFYFYGTDGDFTAKYKLKKECYVVTNAVIYHTLNFNENEPFVLKYHRYKELRRAAILLMKRKGWFIFLLTYIYYFFFSIKMAIKHHNIKYLG